MSDSIPSNDRHVIIGDVLLHCHQESKPIQIIIQTSPREWTINDNETEYIPRVVSSSSRKVFVQKMGGCDVKHSPGIFVQSGHAMKSLTTKNIARLHQASHTWMTKLKSKAIIINSMRTKCSYKYLNCRTTFF